MLTSSDLASFVLAQQAPGAGSFLVQMLPLVAMFGIFWFLLIAPARKRQKAHQAMLESLKRGERVVTSGGIFGEIHAIEGAVIHLKVADNVKIRVAKSSIAGREGESAAEGGNQ